MAALMNLCQGHIVMDSQPPDHQACGLACWWWWGKTKRSILLKFSFHNHIFKWLYFGTIVLAIDDNLRWRRKLKMERGNTLSHFFHPNLHFHMALLGNNGDWQRRNELRWGSCHRQREKGKHSFQRPQEKTLQNMGGKSSRLCTCPRWVVWWMSFWLRGSVQPTYSSKSRNV